MSIFKTPAPQKATLDGQAIGAMTGPIHPPVKNDHGNDVKNLPNAKQSDR